MAVLIEAISIIIRGDALLEAVNDWEQFKRTVPNATLCADRELVRIGFMTPQDAEHYVKKLEALGMRYLEGGRAKNIVVVDQRRGPLAPCDWIDFGHISLDGDDKKRVAACRLKGSTSREVIKPEGWQFEESLSCTYGFAPIPSTDKGMQFLRNENGLDVYWSELSGKEVYVGRTKPDQS